MSAMMSLSFKTTLMRIEQEYIYVPEADSMPLNRWEAYMKTTAISLGYHGRFSIGTINGQSRITVYEKI